MTTQGDLDCLLNDLHDYLELYDSLKNRMSWFLEKKSGADLLFLF